jgi:hypothetical protein
MEIFVLIKKAGNKYKKTQMIIFIDINVKLKKYQISDILTTQ